MPYHTIKFLFGRVRRDRRGITLIEAIVSVLITSGTIYFVMGSMFNTARDLKNKTSREAFQDWEGTVQKRVIESVMIPFLSDQCTLAFKDYWNTKLPTTGGVWTWNPPANVSIIDSLNPIPNTTTLNQPQRFAEAQARCHQGPRSMGAGGGTSHYFCLKFQPTAAAVPFTEFLSMQPVFGEFLFMLVDPTNGNLPVTCQVAGDSVTGLTARPYVGILHYTMYWAEPTTNPPMLRFITRATFSAQGTTPP